jgi:hypothetical protein
MSAAFSAGRRGLGRVTGPEHSGNVQRVVHEHRPAERRLLGAGGIGRRARIDVPPRGLRIHPEEKAGADDESQNS